MVVITSIFHYDYPTINNYCLIYFYTLGINIFSLYRFNLINVILYKHMFIKIFYLIYLRFFTKKPT